MSMFEKIAKGQQNLSLQTPVISPPLTPTVSHEALMAQADQEDMVFHHYIRVIYSFHPSSNLSSTSITVPINKGDLILVHSIHPSGWADGTLLSSGTRGWLPTNYCHSFDHPSIRTLLNALTNIFDFTRTANTSDLIVYMQKEYIAGITIGVRFFLTMSNCLNRNSYLVKSNIRLNRMRRSLLVDLHCLKKTAENLQDVLVESREYAHIHEQLDCVLQKAFKVVTRAVRFLDIWTQESDSHHSIYNGEDTRPLTPPAEVANTSSARPYPVRVDSAISSLTNFDAEVKYSPTETENIYTSIFSEDALHSFNSTITSQTLQLNPSSTSYHPPLTSNVSNPQTSDFSSKRLIQAHESFLGFLGSFIGLRLQSRSSAELEQIIEKSIASCYKFRAVVEEVWESDSQQSEALNQARDVMYTRLAELVKVMKEVYKISSSPGGEDVVPDHRSRLVTAASRCVRIAGECVSKTRMVIEKIGDSESKSAESRISNSMCRKLAITEKSEISNSEHQQLSESKDLGLSGLRCMPHIISDTEVVAGPIATSCTPESECSPSTTFHLTNPHEGESSVMSTNSYRGNSDCFDKSQSANINLSKSTSASSFRLATLHGSNVSFDPVECTRPNSPDQSVTKGEPTSAITVSFGSLSKEQSMASGNCVGVEAKLFGKTYMHELMMNKEGQISGGSLPALVERLTAHDPRPNEVFVTTFYLTFRLFATPVELVTCLVDRFNYIGNSEEVGMPVRSMICDVFWIWLNDHWRSDPDNAALGVILEFAKNQLQQSFPAVTERLADRIEYVSQHNISVSRIQREKSAGIKMSENSFSMAMDGSIPSPVISRNHLSALKNFENGNGHCSFLNFDPQELARQFTILASQIFCAIEPYELLDCEWTKKPDSKSFNVRAMSTLSTDLANLVIDTILQPEEAKKRAAIIKQWTKIGLRLFDLSNYDSLMAIVCALTSSMVLRLKRTWEFVSQKTKNRLEELRKSVDFAKNYSVLRQRLKEHSTPCIPFVGLYLTDLTFVDVGNRSTRKLPGMGSHEHQLVINFDKHLRTAKIIGQLQHFQIPYKLTPVPEMLHWMESQFQRIKGSDQVSAQCFYHRSSELEPRENIQTKESRAESGVNESIASRDMKEKFVFLGTFHFTTSTLKGKLSI